MSTLTWPTDRAFTPQAFTWGFRANDRVYESALNGSVQTASIPGSRWAAVLQFTNQTSAERAALEAFLVRVRREHRIALHRLDRPRPRGTLSLSGVTISTAAGQFASQVVLAGCGANATILAGDMLRIGSQLCMCAADATATAGGVATVLLTHELRAAASAGAAVVTNQPTATFMQASPDFDTPWMGTHHPGVTVELREVFV